MSRLTEEQVETARKAWDDEAHKSLIALEWPAKLIEAIAPHVQYATTDPGAPLTDEEWGSICKNLGLECFLWKRDKSKVDAVLAKRRIASAGGTTSKEYASTPLEKAIVTLLSLRKDGTLSEADFIAEMCTELAKHSVTFGPEWVRKE